MKLFTIPNVITLGNLLSGCMGLKYAFEGNLEYAAYAIFLALILDYLDGFLARILKSNSEIGQQLDSLADMVSFGVLPAYILFFILKNQGNVVFEGQEYLSLLLALSSALRLAKFNIDTRQTDSFIGVPTPANGMLIASLPFIIKQQGFLSGFISTPVILAYIVIMAYLLISELPLFALKFKDFSWKNNAFKFGFIGFCLLLLLVLKLSAVPLIVITYILVSVFKRN
jgi:CDP-diacylglycerol---serine O-phosphatidyltransferase